LENTGVAIKIIPKEVTYLEKEKKKNEEEQKKKK